MRIFTYPPHCTKYVSLILVLIATSLDNLAFAQQRSACGDIIAISQSGVPARSSGVQLPDTCDGRGDYGLQYQCVEYAQRYYGLSSQGLNAKDFYTTPPTGFVAYSNGTSEQPQIGDFIVFDAVVNNSHGHIAVVDAVNNDSVTIIEQNFRRDQGEANLGITQTNGNFYVERLNSDYKALGWVRKLPSTDTIEVQPSPESGKDIWTTSVFSYVPGDPGNGRGSAGGRADDTIRVGGWGDYYDSLIQFDLAGLPLTARSATIELYMYSTQGRGTTSLYLDRITEFWDWRTEGTGRDNDRLWWADKPSSSFIRQLPTPIVGEWYKIDITELYNEWKAGTIENYGVQLRTVSNNNRWSLFYSSRYMGDTNHRPKLVVEP